MVSPDPDLLLATADAHRAQRDWLAAAAAYRQFVQQRPDAWQIVIQEGHCLKEAGRVTDALARYRTAEVQAPDDDDLQLQIGHALKLLDRWKEAARAYQRACELNPESTDAQREAAATATWMSGPEVEAADRLALAGSEDEEAPPAGPPAEADVHAVFDVTDVLDYFSGQRTPTGIQRVQIGIVTRALASAPAGMSVTLAIYDMRARFWRGVDLRGFLRLCALAASGSDPAGAAWTQLRDALRRRINATPRLRFPTGALLVNLGNSWSMVDYFRALRIAQREHGVRYIPFVHDCVPLIVPEHCLAGLVRNYVRWFGALGLHAHGILCNSENTRRDLRRHMGALLPGLVPPAHVVRLDADPRTLLPALAGEDPLPALHALRAGEDFALFVATLESRKNHLLVFNAWLQLVRRHGAAVVPRLVCVGKPGWHAEAALNLLRNAPELQHHVVLMPQVSDQELGALYERCAFTVYNSYYEGWGLPVTEALAHGKVVVTPRHSALTEAGGEAALYFTPQSLPELVALLEKVMLDREFRAEREALVRRRGQPRSWDAVKEEALDAVLALAALPARPAAGQVALCLGEHYPLRRHDGTEPELAPALAEMVREGTGWYPLEEWGVSCAAGTALLRLPLPPGAGVPLRLYLELRAPAGLKAPMELEFCFSAEDSEATLFAVTLPPAASQTCMFDLPATAARVLEVAIDSGEGVTVVEQGESRRLGVGLRGFMLCRLDDHAARIAFLESHSFETGGAE